MSNDLVAVQALKGEIVFAPGGVDKLIEQVATEVRGFKGDISTKVGRDAIASFAYKVARSKTAIDKLGKDLAAELKRQTNEIDAERRRAWDAMEALQVEARKPLTDWEEADKTRIAGHEQALAVISAFGSWDIRPGAAEFYARIQRLQALPARDWQEFTQRARDLTSEVLKLLTIGHQEATRYEDEQAELQRLREEAAARAQKERDDAIAAAAAERARIAAEQKAETEARAAALAAAREHERVETARAAAIARAQRAEAEREAAAAKAIADAKAAEEAAERRRLQAIEDERKRVADEQAAAAAEQRRREASKVHRAKISGEALAALVKIGIGEDHGKLVITAIAKGEVPHIKIEY